MTAKSSQSCSVRDDAGSRTLAGRSLVGSDRACRDAALSSLDTQDRHETTVPKVSKKSARGGWPVILRLDLWNLKMWRWSVQAEIFDVSDLRCQTE